MPIPLLFAGTPDFAVPSLRTLAACDQVQIKAVLTQPDRKQGRGRKKAEPPVKRCAHELGLYVMQYERITSECLDEIECLNPKLIVVAAYGLLLPRRMLELPSLGCVNIHASLLPRWRGAAPVARAIEAGDAATGISIMQMNEGLDEGDVIDTVSEPIDDRDTTESLQQRLSELGANALSKRLPAIIAGEMAATAQDEAHASYAHRLNMSEALIDWSLSAVKIERKIRAFVPWPKARSWLGETQLMFYSAECSGNGVSHAPPGTVVRASRKELVVATGSGCISIKEIQRQGKSRMPIASFLAGAQIAAGTQLSGPPPAH